VGGRWLGEPDGDDGSRRYNTGLAFVRREDEGHTRIPMTNHPPFPR